MPLLTTNQDKETGRRVNVMLTSERVTSAFREALFVAADLAHLTPSEFALMAAAEKLLAAGAEFPGVFAVGDFPDHHNDNDERTSARRTA